MRIEDRDDESGARNEGPAPGNEGALNGEALVEYLRSRRWFGEKSRDIRGATIVDRIPVQWPETEGEYVVARARVDFAGEPPAHYQLFLRTDTTDYRDALEDAAFRHGLIAAFAGGSTCEHRGVRWVIQSESEASFQAPADASVTLSRAEQSNTSLFVGTQAVLKLYRKVAPGIHPDLECTRFLTIQRRFLHTPALLGTIHFVDDQGTWAAGMLQELVPEAKDAWTHALECSREWFAHGGDDVPFVAEAERLGVITRDLHETLGSGDHGSGFQPASATREDLGVWLESTLSMARRALQSANRAEEITAYEQRIRALAAELGDDAGAKIRIHGDYHLGQVLHSASNAFLVVDFEGEPARPLEERRRPHSPLRDVAGMLRSFSYAAAVADEGAAGARGSASSRGSGRRLGTGVAGLRGTTWEESIRRAFLGGYFAERPETRARTGEPKSILPRSRANAERLIALFEAEKAFYELQYELDHRPDWAWIPAQAIARIGEGPAPSRPDRRKGAEGRELE